MADRPLRVLVDARLESGRAGGVEQATIGLAAGLTATAPSDPHTVVSFIGSEVETRWIAPYLDGQRTVVERRSGREEVGKLRRMLRSSSVGRGLLRRGELARASLAARRPLPMLDTTGFDVAHFPTQRGCRVDVPSIYHPWDLQHVHLPELFSESERADRDRRYRELCERAAAVVVPTYWGKADVVRHFALDPERVVVIPLASPASLAASPSPPEVESWAAEQGLPRNFLLYPARTWPHKNHLRLAEAVNVAVDSGADVTVVCSGAPTDHQRRVEARIAALGIESRMKFVGHVSPFGLSCLYRLSRGVVFPSEFEGWGIPISEAFSERRPLAAARIPVIEEVAGDAALLFDPTDVTEMASAIARLWNRGPDLDALIERGELRAQATTWAHIGDAYRRLYHAVALERNASGELS